MEHWIVNDELSDAALEKIITGVIAGLRDLAVPRAFYTPPQLAKLLELEVATVRRWCETGELEASNVAKTATGKKRWKVSQAALDEFLQVKRGNGSSPAAVPKRRRDFARMF